MPLPDTGRLEHSVHPDFHTQKPMRDRTGRSAFNNMVVAPLSLLGLLVARRRPVLAAAVLGLGGECSFVSTPNVRYLYTSMPLLLIAFAGLLGWMMSSQTLDLSRADFYVFACTALNT